MEPKYAEGGHCQSVLRPDGFLLTSPFILNNSVNTAAPFNVVNHPRSESTCLADPFLYCYNWVIQTACIKWCLISGASGLFPIAKGPSFQFLN